MGVWIGFFVLHGKFLEVLVTVGSDSVHDSSEFDFNVLKLCFGLVFVHLGVFEIGFAQEHIVFSVWLLFKNVCQY